MKNPNKYTWTVDRIVPEAPQVASLHLAPTAVKPAFIAGQYLTIKIPNLGPAEGKAYSISNTPDDNHIRITVRKIGTFSSALLSLKPGDTVTTSAPYGFFYPEVDEPNDLILLAGGIGVTPCLSIITQLAQAGDQRKVQLFYSNQTEKDIVFKSELDKLMATHAQLKVHHFITRETLVAPDYRAGRISSERILQTIPDLDQAEFFICGSMDFTKSLWEGLRKSDIPAHKIYTEGFF